MKIEIPWDSIDTITFDVFDTAILRCTPEPRHVFLLVEAALTKTDGLRFQGFAAVRFEAELETVITAWREDRSISPNLEEIYRSVVRLRPDWIEDFERLMELECKTELSIARSNTLILTLYREALTREKTVAFISDTYFSQDHMETLLQNCGYGGPHTVFSSCVEGNNKAAGGLFQIVAKSLKIDPSRTLHIGDDQYSDVTQAKNFGFQARLIPRGSDMGLLTNRKVDEDPYAPTTADVSDILLHGLLQNDALHRLLDPVHSTERRIQFGQIGYSVLGPALTGFTQWLSDKTNDQTDSLYFVSRDGWLLKEAFEKYAASGKIKINSHYLYASRRSLLMSTFRGDPDQVRKICAPMFDYDFTGKLNEYCEFMGISPPTENEIKRHELEPLHEAPFYNMTPADQTRLRPRVEAFFQTRTDELYERAAIERNAYTKYLRSMGLLDCRKIVLVDCGWFGTTQSRIKEVLDIAQPETQVEGYFIGTASGSNKAQPTGSMMTGYLIHEGYSVKRSRDFIEFARIFELFLKTDQKPFYYIEDFPTGELFPVFGADCQINEDLKYMQSEALRFLGDWLELCQLDHVRLRASVLRSQVSSLLQKPTAGQARALGWTSYSPDMDSDETISRFAAPSLNTLEMLFKPSSRRKDVGRSGSRRIYEMLAPSVLARLVVRLTPVDEMPVTPLHGFARRAKKALKRRVWRK